MAENSDDYEPVSNQHSYAIGRVIVEWANAERVKSL